MPPPDYFKTVKQILEHYNILFIADEVQSGFGRTGKMFAIEHYGVEPDIMVMAKGIANGFPLSCFIAPDEIADAFKPGDHLSTLVEALFHVLLLLPISALWREIAFRKKQQRKVKH